MGDVFTPALFNNLFDFVFKYFEAERTTAVDRMIIIIPVVACFIIAAIIAYGIITTYISS